MQRQRAVSSNVESIGYDEPSETLEVEFVHGGVYQYYNFPPHMYEEFIRAPSKGKFLHRYIRNAYPYSRVA